MTPLHIAVKELAGQKPALVFSHEALRGFLLNSFKDAVNRLKTFSVPFEGISNIEARFTGLNVDTEQFELVLDESQDVVTAKINPAFRAGVSLHVAGSQQHEFSAIEIEVTNLSVRLSASAPNLRLGAPDFDPQGAVTESPSRELALEQPGITEEDLIRVEGSMAYVMPHRIVDAVLSTADEIDLTRHFTAFRMLGDWALHVAEDALVILPSEGIEIIENTGCPTNDTVDLSLEPGEREDLGNDSYAWPVTVTHSQPTIHRANDRLDGFAALYAPLPLWETKFSNVLPGISYHERDNGFIGYEYRFHAALRYLGIAIDPARFGIIISMDFVADGSAALTVDVPCVGRRDLANADISIANSKLSILLSFVLSPNGKLLLQAQIDDLKIGDVKADIRFFKRWLIFAGGEWAVRGFLLDNILERIVEHNLPIKFRDAIRDEVNSKNIQLLDLEELEIFTRSSGFNTVTYSGDDNSVLVGLNSDW